MNLLLWFVYDDSGNIIRLSNIQIMPPGFDLDKHFVDYLKPPFSGGGIDRIEREWVEVPESLMGVQATSFVLYAHGKRFRAAMPYFQTISPA